MLTADDLRGIEVRLAAACVGEMDGAVYPTKPCHWCGGIGLDAHSRARTWLESIAFQHPPDGTPAGAPLYSFVRLACFNYGREFIGGQIVILCPYADLLGHYDDLLKLGYVAEIDRPKDEWKCERCGGTGELRAT